MHFLDTRLTLLRSAMLASMGLWTTAQARAAGLSADGSVGRGISLSLAAGDEADFGVLYDLSLDLTAADTAIAAYGVRF